MSTENEFAQIALEMLDGSTQYKRFYYDIQTEHGFHEANLYARELMSALRDLGKRPGIRVSYDYCEVWIDHNSSPYL